jgi:tRNA(adenine34) deaminase
MMALRTLLGGPRHDMSMVDGCNTSQGSKLPDTGAEVSGDHTFSRADADMMRLALEEARRAATHGDVPIGAVVARVDDVLAAAGNERELRGDPTAHAEVLALRAAAERLGGWRIPDATIYVTLEPCAMCAGAIVLARVQRVVYAAADPKAGAAGSVLDVLGEPHLNHRARVEDGLLAAESAALLEAFFAARR